MKLTNNHIIIILVCVLVFSAISGPSLEEGMQNISSTRNMVTRKLWRGENLSEQKCINIPGAKYIKHMNPHQKRIYHAAGCNTAKSCCVPHLVKNGNRKNARRRRRQQRRNGNSVSKDYVRDYVRDYVNDYVNDYENDYENDYKRDYNRDSGSDYGSDSGSDYDSDYGSDSGSDSDNEENYNKHNDIVNNVSMPYQPPQPDGVYASDIPNGEEDKYILKSEIVPPVCPACPPALKCPKDKKETPCPPCARCPEPSFECKKIPTYKKSNDVLPVPMLNDFSKF